MSAQVSAQASPLLFTKLNRPPVTSDRVDRPRLIEQLDRGLQQGPLTLVCAAAGFGKTTLVSSWIERLSASRGGVTPPLQSAWLSLNENDSDLVVFLRYFIAAIRTVFPESCAETLALLGAPYPAAQAPLVIALGNELERLPGRVVLVLDDYHAIRGEAVHDFLSELLRHWPQRLHLVLISRSSPPLPLANLRAKGQVAEIRTRDMRFTPEEAAAFLERVLAAPFSPSAVALLDQRLEGWIAGLRLVTLSLRVVANAETELAELSGTSAEIADYLVDEVMSSQTPAILRFLLATSVLDRFCAALCQCVLGSADSGVAGSDGPPCDVYACIQWVERNNLFVIPLDNDRQWYRYHHLFQELLQRRLLAEVGPEQVTELHRRAAAWFAGQGFVDEALHHALAAADLDLAARLMEAGLCDALNWEDRATLDRWLRLLPEEFIQGRPWLLIVRAFALQFAWQLPAVWRLLGQVEALLAERPLERNEGAERAARSGEAAPYSGDPHDLPVLRGLIAGLRGQQAFTNSQAARAIACCEEAFALLPQEWRYVRGGTLMYWIMSMRAIGRSDAAYRTMMGQYESLPRKSDAYALRLLFTVCLNFLETADLERVRQMAQAALQQARAGRLMIIQGWLHYLLGMAHYCWNELDDARQHFTELVDKRYAVHAQSARNGMIGLVRVHLARGEISAATPIMELLSQLDVERMGQEADDARSLRAQLAYRQGDTEAAFRWADADATPAPDRLLTWLQDPHLAKAQILLARGTDADVQAALDILDALHEIAQRSFSVRFQIEILALRALALEMHGKAGDALAVLQQAVELARPGGILRAFVDLGLPMQTMLLRLAKQGFAVETVRRILAAFPEPRKKSETSDAGSQIHAANARLIEPLTDRELEVLVLLRERLSNKEIAHKLVLSPMTVKRHLVNLYGKLGVNKRWDAVIKAEALEILPPR
jgi:LuxR family transcriptional regulator, maltose regulon positive regulatory protein